MALRQHLAAAQKSAAPGQQLGAILQVFAEHGQKASCRDAVDFLGALRGTRDQVSKSPRAAAGSLRRDVQQWTEQCVQHAGFKVLRERLLQQGQDGVAGLQGSYLSRAYNQLQRMALREEASAVWPAVLQGVKSGQMKEARELVGVWAVAPEAELAAIDAPLAKALTGGDMNSWMLLGTLARASSAPASKAIASVVTELGKRLQQMDSEDLAALIPMCISATTWGETAPPRALVALAESAKVELALRAGFLEPVRLCGLLSSIETCADPLWPMVRKQLLSKRNAFTPVQCLDVLRFLTQLPGGVEEDKAVYAAVLETLQDFLQKKATPGLVAMIGHNLELVQKDLKTCRALMNAAVTLRRDLFPSALWALFLSISRVDLVSRHPELQMRMQRIGEILEQHHDKLDTMTLTEMHSVAVAMRRTNVPLKKCTDQMAQKFLSVLEAAEGSAATNLLGEAQELLVLFWAEVSRMGLEQSALEEAVRRMAAPGGNCRLEPQALARCVLQLDGLSSEDVQETSEGLTSQLLAQLPKVPQSLLLELVADATAGPLRAAVVGEVARRLRSVASLRRAGDLDDLVQLLRRCAAWPTGDAGFPEGLVRQAAGLVAESLPQMMQQEPASAHARLLGTVQALAAHGEGAAVPLQLLGRALHGMPSEPAAPVAGLADAAALSFGFCALHGGKPLTMDVAAKLWRHLGAALRGTAGSSAAEAAVASGRSAEIWMFLLCVRHLSSPSTLAALRLMPDAPILEACLAGFGTSSNLGRAREAAGAAQEPEAAKTMDKLRAGLPGAVPAGEPVEERFGVPGTPFVADLALTGRRVLVFIPGAAHRAPAGGAGRAALSGRAKVQQALLEALDWEVRWAWPKDWAGDAEEGSEGAADAEALGRFLLGAADAAPAAAR